ncbi:MAG: RNA ligase RtcB family protein [Myxococcales bacterium]|nr:RNA ligase RtcB family protein [Myxococcales bacterium]
MELPTSPDVVATGKTWIESAALEQLRQVAGLPGMVRVVGMPDLHPGAGSPVGAAFLSDGLIYPHLVGSDIGCGMALWDTGLPLRKVKLDRLERRLDLEAGTPGAASIHLPAEGASPTGHEDSLGTIGGGNHFAELVKVERVLEQSTLRSMGADPGNAWLLVHSGSRGVGHAINRRHVAKWHAEGVEPDSDVGRSYLEAHDNAVRWASANRAVIAERFLAALGSQGRRILDIAHNSVQPDAGAQGHWLNRKGAAPTDSGPVVIPGSRGDLSFLVTPAGSGDRNLSSLAHGAGRKWARSEAKGKLGGKADPKALRRTRFGSRVICDDKALLFEEAPQAYKPAADVIAALVEAGMATVIAETSPLLTYKTRRDRR